MKILLIPIMTLLLIPFAFAVTNVSVNIYSDGDVEYHTNIGANNTKVYINGQIPFETHTYKVGGSNNALNAVSYAFQKFLRGDTDGSDKQVELMQALYDYGNNIMDAVYNRYIKYAQLDMIAQKNMNTQYQTEIDELRTMMNMSLSKYTINCKAYVQMMIDGYVDTVDCTGRDGELQHWTIQSGQPLRVIPIE